MKLNQLSLFLENRPGQLHRPFQVLGDAGVDVLTATLADTEQFGILRLVVKDAARARAALQAAGLVVADTEVLAIEVDDGPGGLASALVAIEQAKLSVEYMYAVARNVHAGKAAVVFRFEDGARAAEALQAAGVRVLRAEELFGG